MFLGALAIADEGSRVPGCLQSADEIAERALGTLRHAANSWNPTGGWCEGSGYDATAQYSLALEHACLATAMNPTLDMFSLMNGNLSAGDPLRVGDSFWDSGMFNLYMVTPVGPFRDPVLGLAPYGSEYNFGDENWYNTQARTWAHMYIPSIHRYDSTNADNNACAWLEERRTFIPDDTNTGAPDLLWYVPLTADYSPHTLNLPKERQFKGENVDVVTVRSDWPYQDTSGWHNTDAAFVGVRGGSNQANHGHGDLGSYSFESLGVRFAEDGFYPVEDFPNAWDMTYWAWYAFARETLGHNAVRIDGANQNVYANASLVFSTQTRADGSNPVQEITVDLSDAYQNQASSAVRKISLLPDKRLVVRDRVTPMAKSDVESGFAIFATTSPAPASPVISGATTTLKKEDMNNVWQTYYARIINPSSATWGLIPLNNRPLPDKKSDPNFQNMVRLSVDSPGSVGATDIAYVLAPASTGDITPPNEVTNLTAKTITRNSVILTWTCPGNDGSKGLPFQYDFRYRKPSTADPSADPITEFNWGSATRCTGVPIPFIAGLSRQFTVTGLTPNTAYSFAMRTVDSSNNWSWISNVVNFRTGP